MINRWIRRLCLLFLGVMPCPVGLAVGAEPVILVLGDSLSAAYGIEQKVGWVERLRQRIAQADHPHRVVNASISGETTRGGLARLPELLARHRPAIVIIELGGNDGLRGTPIPEIRRNLSALVEKSQQSGAQVVLVGMQLPPNYGPAYTKQFRDIYVSLAQDRGVSLVPFLLEGVAGQSTWMQPDGIHPRAEAQEKILENVWPRLKPLLAK